MVPSSSYPFSSSPTGDIHGDRLGSKSGSSDDPSLQPSCFSSAYCNGVSEDTKEGSASSPPLKYYTDKDFAAEMNAMTNEERQAILESLHGVSRAIPESPELVDSKIAELLSHLEYIPAHEKDAWDRAVFLRPSLARDRRWFLTCLRARRFKARDAARLLVNYYENKRQLFGDDLLTARLTWKDLTTEEQSLLSDIGVYQVLLHREKAGRPIVFCRINHWHVTTAAACNALVRVMFYTYSSFFVDNCPDEMMQRRGAVFVADWRGGSCCLCQGGLPVLKFIKSIANYADDAPFHVAGVHMLSDKVVVNSVFKALWPLLKKDYRLRNRLHFGSGIETAYSLNTFGITLEDCLDDDHDETASEGQNPPGTFDTDIHRRLQSESAWLKSEEAFRQPHSPTGLYPNPNDIIMGRNKKVALAWPGNILFRQTIQRKASDYIEARGGVLRYNKTKVALSVLATLKGAPYHCRFLVRGETCWRVIGDAEARKKISQALRKIAREEILGVRKTTASEQHNDGSSASDDTGDEDDNTFMEEE